MRHNHKPRRGEAGGSRAHGLGMAGACFGNLPLSEFKVNCLKLMSLDTSTPRGSVALLDGEELTAELRLRSLEDHSSRLLENIRYLLGCVGWKLGDLGL